MRSSQPFRGIICLALFLTLAAGCDSLIRSPGAADQEPTEFSSVRLPGVSMEAARSASLAALKEHFRLDSTASTGTVLVSRPLESDDRADNESGGVRGMISGSSNRHRQIAQLRLVDRGPDVLVRVHVQVQRLDVTDRAAFVPHQAADDRPSNLPAERYPRSQTLTEKDWQNVGRNRQLEQTLADSIAERLAPQIAGVPGETPASKPQ